MIIFDGEKVLIPEGRAPRHCSVRNLGKYFVDALNDHSLTSSNKAEPYRKPQVDPHR
jgi:hypothetical protein